jgi:hypothetical protein
MTIPDGSSLSDLVLFWVVALVGLNHLLMRISGIIQRLWAFIPVQLINLATAAWLMAIGIPEFKKDEMLWILNWVLGLLLIFHIIQNNMRLQRQRKTKGRPSPNEVRAERDRIEAALRSGAEDSTPDEGQTSSS